MTKYEAAKHYTSQRQLAFALGLQHHTVVGWKDGVPALHQIRLERMTGGALVADPEAWAPAEPTYPPPNKSRRKAPATS